MVRSYTMVLCITCRVQGPIAIRYENVAMDSGLGQGKVGLSFGR